MGLVRSNWNSVCSVSDNFVALKERITTCLKDWRQKASKSSVQQYNELQQHLFFHKKPIQNIKFINNRLKNLFLSKRTEENFKAFRLKRTSRNSAEDCAGETVTKLVLTATTVVATQTTTTTSKRAVKATTTEFAQLQKESKEEEQQTEQENSCSIINSFGNNSIGDMTIISDVFLEIRDEYPDLEAEVRSLLTARAQNGATICEIKDDYRKLTGLHFPIYNNVTEFLLSIPNVTAYCNERGTRIFNIIPSGKTQHVYDLVTAQKPQVTRPYIRFGQDTAHPGGANRIIKSVYSYHNNGNNKNENRYYNNNRTANSNGMARTVNATTRFQNTNRYHQPEEEPDILTEKKSTYEENYCHLQTRFNLHPQITTTTYNLDYNEIDNHNNNINHNYHTKNNNNSIDVDFIPPKGHNYNNNITMFQKNFMPLNNLAALQQQQQQQQQQHQQQQQQQQMVPNTLNPSSVHPYRPTQNVPNSSPSATRSSEYNDSVFTLDSDFQAHMWDFLLLGDDFFLYLARMELRCKFKKFERVLQSGLCISGQTITTATKRIQHLTDVLPSNRSIIVNIGSVDIMQGKPLVQIEHDFRALVNVIRTNGFTPILTTLAPLANYAHIKKVKEKLERFNEFIKREGRNLIVVDIWSCLVNEKRQILFDCFQNEPRRVSGTSEPYVFWNKIGRQRVLQLISENIEY